MHVEEWSTEANAFLIKILSYEEKDNDKVLVGRGKREKVLGRSFCCCLGFLNKKRFIE